jgi:hypothetical protein
MALNDKVKSAVDVAFAKIDSLLVPVVFSNKSATSFDFAAGQVSTSNSTFSTRGLKESKKSFVDGSSVTKLVLLVKTDGIVFSGYTSVSVDGVQYGCSILESNDYVTSIELVGGS